MTDELYVTTPWLSPSERERIQTEFKIPVDSEFPGTYWIAQLDSESVMPTDAELLMLRSFIDFSVIVRYTPGYQRQIFGKPLPGCGGHVTKVFRKGARWLNGTNPHNEDPLEGWKYRRSTWDHGLVPLWPNARIPTLEQCLDATQMFDKHLNPAWLSWKRDHVDIFRPNAGHEYDT